MLVLDKANELRELISQQKSTAKSIGFVPTMGALHQGHISLVEQAKKDCDICVVSIFVNPNQFNNKEDLAKYPRNIEQDIKLLKSAKADFIFIPTVEEIYPEPDTRQFEFGELDKVMEGKHRPGHFNGVAQVVSRLFGLVKPDKAYFGEKDFQQLAIIRDMVKQLSINTQIVSMPIIREENGLAISSRNERLSSSQKEVATTIYSSLLLSKNDWFEKESVDITIYNVISRINLTQGLEVEYFEIVDGNNLQAVRNWSDSNYIVGCITVYCGDVRLIDNIVYKK